MPLWQRKDCSLKSMWWIQASLYAEVLVNSQNDHAITLIGPVAVDTRGPRQSRTRIGCDALYDGLAATASDVSHRSNEPLVDQHP